MRQVAISSRGAGGGKKVEAGMVTTGRGLGSMLAGMLIPRPYAPFLISDATPHPFQFFMPFLLPLP